MTFSKILVALDLSPQSQTTFDHALRLAQAAQAELLLFSSLEDTTLPQPLISTEMGLYSNLIPPDTQPLQHQRAQVQESLQRYAALAQAEGLRVETVCPIGDASSLICNLAQTWQANLIVVGRRGLKGLSEALLGSVSNHVVHHAPCSVLVVQGEGLS